MFKFFDSYIIGSFLLFELILKKLFLARFPNLKFFFQGFPLNLIGLLLLQVLQFDIILRRFDNDIKILWLLHLLVVWELLFRLFYLLLLIFLLHLQLNLFSFLERDQFPLSWHHGLLKFWLSHFLLLIFQLLQLHRSNCFLFILGAQTQ